MAIRYLSGINVDSTTLFVNDANNLVGIGTGSPAGSLHIQKNSGNYSNEAIKITGTPLSNVTDGTSATEGYGLYLSYNISGNRQFVFADTVSGNGVRYIGTSLDGFNKITQSRQDLNLGTETNGVHVAAGISNTQFSVSNVGGTASKIVTEIKGAASQTGNYLNISSSSGVGDIVSILSSGNVGIGTTSPSEKLEVAGSIKASGGLYSDNGSLAGNIGLGQVTTIVSSFGSYANLQFTMHNGGGFSDIMKLQGNGNVGIGTTSPNYPLHVNGSVLNQLARFESSDNGALISIKDDDTTIYLGAEGSLAYLGLTASASSNNLIVNSDGNVGIGTTSPAAKLDITGGSIQLSTSGSGVFFGPSSAAQIIGVSGASSYLALGTVGAERMRITSGGNVGIGTTAPGSKLHVWNGGVQVTGFPSSGSPFTFLQSDYNDAAVTVRFLNVNPSNGFDADLGIQLSNTSNVMTDVMRIKGSTGNVGIGTTSPSAKLHVSSSTSAQIKIEADTDNITEDDVAELLMTQDGAITTANYSLNSDNNLVIGVNSTTSPNIYIATRADGTSYASSADSKLTILNGGNVGIGTTNPGATYSEKLQVLGSSLGRINVTHTTTSDPRQSDILFTENNTITFQVGTVLSNGTYGDQNWLRGVGSLPVTIHTDSLERLRVTSSGNVGIGTTSPGQKLTVDGTAAAYSAIGASDNVRTGLAHYDTTAQAVGVGGQLVLGYKYTDAGDFTEGAIIKMYKENGTSGAFGSGLKFQVRNDGANLSTKLILDPSGNLGVGTTSPTNPLHVSKDAGGSAIAFFESLNSDGYGVAIRTADTGNDKYVLRLDSNSGTTPVMYASNAGNVGIGTTFSGINTASLLTIKASSAEGNQIYIVQNNDDRGWRFKAKNDGHLYLDSAYSSADQNVLVARYDTGNIGIGTTNPGVTLDVNGSGIRITNATTPNVYFNNTTVQWKAYMPSGVNSFAINNSVNDVLTLGYNGAASYFSGCNVGIGTTNPSGKLHVASGSIVLNSTYSLYLNSSIGDENWRVQKSSAPDITRSLVSQSSLNLYAHFGTGEGFVVGANGGNSYYEILGSGPTHFFRGNALIGTATDAGYKLDVNGVIRALSVGIVQASSNSDTPNIAFTNNGTSFTWGTIGGLLQGDGDGALFFNTKIGGSVTEKMRIASTGAIKFNAYGSGSFTGTPTYNLGVDASGNVIELPGGVVDGSGTANQLARWQDANTLTSAGIEDNGSAISIGRDAFYSATNYGTAYSSVTGASGGTAWFDTVTASSARLYNITIFANPNASGSGSYKDFYYGKIIIGNGYNGSAVVDFINYHQESPQPRSLYGSGGGNLTVTAVFVYGGSEVTEVPSGATYTIRIKISGYNNAGANTQINLQRIM